jgi:hypothetical protein
MSGNCHIVKLCHIPQEQRTLLEIFHLTGNECGKTSVNSRQETLEQLKVTCDPQQLC